MASYLRFFGIAPFLLYVLLASSAQAQTPQQTQPLLPSCVLTANPPAIAIGGSVTLKWRSSNATSGIITHIGSVDLNGSLNILPSSAAQMTFVGTFTGPGGTATCQATITVSSSGGGGGVYGAGGTYSGGGGNANPNDTGSYDITPYTVNPADFQTQPSSNQFSQTPTTVSPPTGSGGRVVSNFLVPCGLSSASDPLSATSCDLCSFGQLIQNIINFLIIIAVPLSAGLFAWAGILLFTGGDNPSRVTRAHKIFYSVAIGLVIAMSGYLIVQTLLNALLSGEFKTGGWSWNSLRCSQNRPRQNLVPEIFQGLFNPSGTGGVTTTGGPTSSSQGQAQGSSGITVIKNSDGTVTINTGGSVSWRNNNPGNMIAGAPGYSSLGTSGGFAVFPDYQTGFNAMIANLQTPRYQSQTIAGAMAVWAPLGHGNNDPVQYAGFVSSQTQLPADTPMSSLNHDQLVSMANAIQKYEGWVVGTSSH